MFSNRVIKTSEKTGALQDFQQIFHSNPSEWFWRDIPFFDSEISFEFNMLKICFCGDVVHKAGFSDRKFASLPDWPGRIPGLIRRARDWMPPHTMQFAVAWAALSPGCPARAGVPADAAAPFPAWFPASEQVSAIISNSLFFRSKKCKQTATNGLSVRYPRLKHLGFLARPSLKGADNWIAACQLPDFINGKTGNVSNFFVGQFAA